nr:MAG TPA: hypothetical protein [Caudoviricetes sp.]DAR22348.1 MAG TPA: hypothetical protein [Caudoviricetes sp.]
MWTIFLTLLKSKWIKMLSAIKIFLMQCRSKLTVMLKIVYTLSAQSKPLRKASRLFSMPFIWARIGVMLLMQNARRWMKSRLQILLGQRAILKS